MGEITGIYRILAENPGGKRPVDGRIMLQDLVTSIVRIWGQQSPP
jgi:hypothetical protein